MDIRQEFLDFFKSKKHQIYSSMPLTPNDSSLLFTNAGMVQFKDIFTGSLPTPSNPKAASCQLCLRAGGKHNDLENVGYTSRHHTLFEMLGNFSFGDYFKQEAIAYAWEFITKNLQLDIDRLWVTVHKDDNEAYKLWQEHISKDRIKKFGDKDNFWSMGPSGACGPCSEIFYDQGSKHFNTPDDYLGGDGDRFLEIWNLVFMQYSKDTNGKLTPLPHPSIDTGMGLERIVAIKEGVYNNFDSSYFKPLIDKIAQLRGSKADEKTINSHRVIADHTRAVCFMLSQGILFDKEGRGYVLRRILRRAVRHGYLLGLKEPFMAKLLDTLIEIMGSFYKELQEQKEYIKEQITLEEQRFFKTIDNGMALFEDELRKTSDVFSGDTAFKLYDTYGFPLDLTQDMLRQKNITIDIKTFNHLMDKQKSKAKSSWKGVYNIDEQNFKPLLEKYGKNTFTGYNQTSNQTKILALLDENFDQIDQLSTNQTGWIMLEQTPFYAQSGGQCGDVGILKNESCTATVDDTKKFFDLNLSKIKVATNTIKSNDTIQAIVINRQQIAKHHSATHLLQSALKKVLGNTISQAGSYNDEHKLRFDFTYPKPLTQDEIQKVQDIVNEAIAQAIPLEIDELPIDLAKKSGAIATFGEKYGDIVRVVKFGDFSIEFCGGTHTPNTANIGSFYITKESGVSAGVRRIEAVCGISAINYAQSFIKNHTILAQELKTSDTLLGIKKLKEQIKNLKNEINTLQSNTQTPLNELSINNTKVVVDIIQNGDLKQIVDDLKNQNEQIAILLLQAKQDKVLMVSGVKNANIKAGDWIKEIAPIVGGGGGGRADFAQAGGKDISKIDQAKTKALEFAKKSLER